MTLAELIENRIVMDPRTGEVIDPKDVDALAEKYAELDAIAKQIGETLRAIRLALSDLSQGDAQTRRVRGERSRVKLVFDGPRWNQGTLRQIWKQYPLLAPDFIRIERLAPKLVEVRKLQNECGGQDFAHFRKLLLDAEEPNTAPPRVYLETSTQRELDAQELSLRRDLVASLAGEEDGND